MLKWFELIVIWLFFMVIVYFAYNIGIIIGYKEGQIDAQSGKIKYILIEKSEKIWELKK